MIKFDFWYGNIKDDADRVDVFFYPNDGVYRGNLYKNKKAIADFVSDSSTDVEKAFPGIFGR